MPEQDGLAAMHEFLLSRRQQDRLVQARRIENAHPTLRTIHEGHHRCKCCRESIHPRFPCMQLEKDRPCLRCIRTGRGCSFSMEAAADRARMGVGRPRMPRRGVHNQEHLAQEVPGLRLAVGYARQLAEEWQQVEQARQQMMLRLFQGIGEMLQGGPI